MESGEETRESGTRIVSLAYAPGSLLNSPQPRTYDTDTIIQDIKGSLNQGQSDKQSISLFERKQSKYFGQLTYSFFIVIGSTFFLFLCNLLNFWNNILIKEKDHIWHLAKGGRFGKEIWEEKKIEKKIEGNEKHSKNGRRLTNWMKNWY